MSIQLIQQYHTKIAQIIQYGGSKNESSVRKAFQDLLEQYARGKNLLLIAELDYRTVGGQVVYPDGTLKDALRQDWGYWESKDQQDDLAVEISKKLALGYPASNILFEDTQTAILYQAGKENLRADFRDDVALDTLLTKFISYEPHSVREFHDAISRFAQEVPLLAQELRDIIDEQYVKNQKFQTAAHEFLELCQEAINPAVVLADVREMLIQHILTQDIFTTVFDEAQFHLENNIAHRLGEVANTFFKGATRHAIHDRLLVYYAPINARAAQIQNHHEKQKFLKVLYETFYKAYNPKAADRLGVVYTPNEIVRFMIEGADYLVHKHFGKTLGSRGVEILDPATGTATFITELIDYLPPHLLEHKYRNEIHCNEVAILPYYIANLNIEFTYKQKMGKYVEFENILFVDTLDNMGFVYGNKQYDMFGLVDENSERIKRQNERKISVIIGNPPYNANQLNENENNKNRPYPAIDKHIRETYVKHSTAQKTNVYDMYTRFYRWASDRLAENGIIAFITNRSFIDARGYDGFRKVVSDEFSHIYIIDLGGDVRKNPKLSGPKHNVFAIQTGVAICFMVRQKSKSQTVCRIFYSRRPEMELAQNKLEFLTNTNFDQIDFDLIQPGNQHEWLNQIENNWDDLLPIVLESDLEKQSLPFSIFEMSSNGINTSRDEWAYDFSHTNLALKAQFFIEEYNHEVNRWIRYKRDNNYVDTSVESNPIVDDFLHERNIIKWSSRLKRDKLRKEKLGIFDKSKIRRCIYRPFVKQFLCCDYTPIDLFGQQLEYFPSNATHNIAIGLSGQSSTKPFQALVSDNVIGYDLLEKTCSVALYHYDPTGTRHENITDWAMTRFQSQYGDTIITKLGIFHYVYAVLHNPAYRTKYEINLKRSLPRIPLYADFWQWADWGKRLLELHLHYETVEAYPLTRTDSNGKSGRYQAQLKADKQTGSIQLDIITTLSGVPASAWTYKLGNRSALEWILERYKESTPKDPTIRAKFNTYRFVDYKEQVIDLLQRVTTVSVETMKIITEMENL